ncbi:hypothetical protein Bca52824_011111 [Brassica carinata]|uniref:DUF1985 domain-containing protein n=1 Tax=Brassica carinata TaxID=52824 RepID=A0A8X7WCN1_BRACI|nr:hypothetical protein Bca52824_011111 [Brassica carinata]
MRKPKNKKKRTFPTTERNPQTNLEVFFLSTSLADTCLPPRLFVTDRFPTKDLNIYSSPDLLPFIRNVLRGTPEFETIRKSCFGKLFDLPARHCPVSYKLIHSFLTRQLLCLPKNTLWSVFGGFPFRYGLEEFGTVTGLSCGPFPAESQTNTGKAIIAGKDSVWKRLFGRRKVVTIAELCRMLETDENMSGWKKIRIALIIIVDGVLIAHKQEPRPTPRYVWMVETLKKFFAFPWGRESFLKTITCMKPPKLVGNRTCEDPVRTLVKKLKQRTFRLQGLPLSLQLVAFPPLNNLTLIDLVEGCLPPHTSHPNHFPRHSTFTPIIPIESQPEPGWGVWTDDEKEDSVIYLEQLIADGYTFNKQMWPGGATSEPLIGKPKTRVKKKPVTIKQSLKSRQPSATKQRRISSYFKHSSNNSFTNAQLTEIVIQHTKQLRRVMKRRNKRSHGRQSSFHATLPLRKKSYASPHPCQHNNEHDAASEPDELPESLSPIISQYAAQLQRDQIAAPQPVCNSSIHTPTVHVSSDHIDDSPPRTPVTVQPPWSQLNSVIYDKSEHPNSPEIHHILYHGVRIYDSINPDPPIFDSSIPPASPRRSRLLLSPLPTTPLTSPTKSSDNVAGFAVHAATVNAFAATASSNSPACLGSRSLSPKESVDRVVDLTNVKDIGRHVPTLQENHLAQELSRSPLIPALAVISPLPELEWDLFYNIISQKKDVYHTTPYDLEFSNKLLLELAKPKQWTTTHVCRAISSASPNHTMSSSTSSSRSHSRSTLGIPSRCWCGSKLTTFASQTKENLYRRFYRCEIGVKLEADVQSFKNSTTQRLQEHAKHADEALFEMRRIIHDQAASLAELKRRSDNLTQVIEAGFAPLGNGSAVTKPPNPLLNIAAAAIALGTLAWLYGKLST